MERSEKKVFTDDPCGDHGEANVHQFWERGTCSSPVVYGLPATKVNLVLVSLLFFPILIFDHQEKNKVPWCWSWSFNNRKGESTWVPSSSFRSSEINPPSHQQVLNYPSPTDAAGDERSVNDLLVLPVEETIEKPISAHRRWIPPCPYSSPTNPCLFLCCPNS